MLSKQIIDYIKEMYQSGKTQQEIAAELHTDQQSINRLLSGRRVASGLTIGTFEKMFPKAEIFLHGVQVSGDHSVNIQGGIHESSPSIDKILDSDDLTAEEKIKMIKVLKK